MKRETRQKKYVILAIALVAAPILLGIAAIGVGRYSIGVREILECLLPPLFPGADVDEVTSRVIFDIRLPRVLLAIIAGAGLAVAGAAFQGIFANPLATPDTLGVASGASFGAAFAILLGFGMMYIQLMAVVWGVIAVIVAVALISGSGGRGSTMMLILAGMVVGALFSALLSIIKYVADPQDVLPSITYWLMGSLTDTTFSRLAAGAPMIIGGTLVIYLVRWRLNVMSLHEDEAKALGVNVKRVRVLVIAACTMITAAVIAMCGQIGWIGLLIPHIARMICGNDNRRVIPACIGLGATFLLATDTVARSVSSAEIPVSILTSIIGAPIFIILLRKTGGVKS
ncbi:MAG: iron ABC transporter permease [Clostridiales Family XIII bacterium]|jgi:iron complex transport system permease protein|nr:iron ABC transporter permease [Clostridiales Family XIII bacterium]